MSSDLEKQIEKLKQDRVALLEKIGNIAGVTNEVVQLEAVNSELDPLLDQLDSWRMDNHKLRYQETGQ